MGGPIDRTYVGALGAAVVCYAALGAVVGILPRYVPDRLGGGSLAIGLAVGAPALTGLLARPAGGRLADRIGPFSPLAGGALVMAAGAVPAALSASLWLLLASRLLVGAGEGVMMAATVLWLLRLAGPERRGRALGHIGLANYVGLSLGPLLADALGGVSASRAVLWAAAALPLLGAGLADLARRTGRAEVALRGRRDAGARDAASTRRLLRLTAPAGVGLLLVNIGYVSVLSFGAAVARTRGTGLEAAILPVFAAAIVFMRTAGGGIPDRLGGRRTVAVFAGLEALGLVVYAGAGTAALALGALIVLSVGQAMAVPGLGLLALARVRPNDQGAAAGLFFAWFDGGVGLGGPAVGAVASLAGPGGGLRAAAGAVAVAVLVAAAAARPAARSHRSPAPRSESCGSL
jgi:predicted MFS family arabinose efflux permease